MDSIENFDPTDSENISQRWDIWLKGLKAFLKFKGITDSGKQIGGLLHYGGPEIRSIYETEIETDPEEEFKVVAE